MLRAATIVHGDDVLGDICSSLGEQAHDDDGDVVPFVFVPSPESNGVEDRESNRAFSILISVLGDSEDSY